MEITFHGKRALVTGASQGIGRDIATQLAKCGAKVIALARNTDLLVSLMEEVPSIEYFVVDLADWVATRSVLEKVGDIDLLVNNAAFTIFGSLEEITEEQINKSISINLKAVINITQYVAANLKGRKAKGSIVHVSSQSSVMGFFLGTICGATKGAVDAFTRATAKELGPFGIRVNTINPTVTKTEMGDKLVGWSDPVKANIMLKNIPLGRFAEIRDITDAVLFLLSEKSSIIIATSLLIDGGWTAT